jgi:mono/diheme cytochrome c family protein
MTSRKIASRLIPTLWLSAVAALFFACTAQSLGPTGAAAGDSSRLAAGPATEGDRPAPHSTPNPPPSARAPSAPPAPAAGGISGGGDDALLARGRELFARQCMICHGENGDGAGKFAYLMSPRPRDFRKGMFKLASTQNQIPSDEDLLRTISRGMPGSAMPPWGHLPLADLKALVAFVRQVHIDAVRMQLEAGVKDGTYTAAEVPAQLAELTQPGPAVVVPPEPKFDDLKWFNGRRVYLEACASCHGVDGHPVAEAVKFDEEGYPDPPRSFVAGIFKGGMDGPDLYCRVIKGMRGTPMPASEGNYTSDEIWDLVHYTQSLARAGSQTRAELRQGTITAPRVRDSLPAGPKDPAWSQARPLYVAMTPLWWTEDRIEGAMVQALHNGKQLALRLMWLDKTTDDRSVRVEEFRDAVAIQFSLSSDPPFYMGDASQHGGVNIWVWKADRQKNIDAGYQDVDAAFPMRAVDMYAECPIRSKDMSLVDWPHGAITEHNPTYLTAWGAGNLVADPALKTPVECLTARGPGTLSGKPAQAQVVAGQAVYERGMWMVQLQREMELPQDHAHNGNGERTFRPGDYLPVSLAIWNGAAGDRDGKKNISIWQKLVIE